MSGLKTQPETYIDASEQQIAGKETVSDLTKATVEDIPAVQPESAEKKDAVPAYIPALMRGMTDANRTLLLRKLMGGRR